MMMTSRVLVIFTLSLLDVFETSVSDYVDDGLYPGNQDLGQKRLNYPAGLRRKPNLNGMPSLDFDQDQEDFLEQIVDEQARRRFHKQIEQQLEEISRQLNYNYKLNSRFRDRFNFKSPFPIEGGETFNSPEFEYNLPKSSAGNGEVVFGITPADPRYKVDDVVDSYEEDFKHTPDVDNEQQVLFKFINPQKNPMNTFKTNNIFSPGNAKDITRPSSKIPQLHPENNNFVMKESIGQEGETNVYVVALIAGVTAAVTVGLIVLVVAWYTLHKKSKAASDMDYPAYGVTGPCREVSQTSGDKRLAQSAEIYHYQHQKQQIIAMEKNVPNDLSNAAISDVESEDDNEEGDYTVYECPGLAPTCEMEVKNPLFLDETPVTPSGGKNQNTE